MFAIAVIGVFVVYAAVSLLVVGMVASFASKRGRRGWVWGLGAAFVMYNSLFWDWLPTVYAHKYYCEKEAGFWVYKTLDQWKAENPGVMEGLHQSLEPIQQTSYGYIQILDERFAIETHREFPVQFLTTKVDSNLLVDRKNGMVLAKGVAITSGVGNPAVNGALKFWLNQDPCTTQGIWNLSTEINNMRGRK